MTASTRLARRALLLGAAAAGLGGPALAQGITPTLNALAAKANAGTVGIISGGPDGTYVRIAADLAVHVRGIRVMGSAAGDLAAVAFGEIDAVLGFGLAPWDVAAGEAIVLAAGGTVRHQDSTIGVPAMISGPVGLVDAIAGLASRLT